MIRLIIAEDQAMVSGALAALLGMEHDLQVVGQAKNGQEALNYCQQDTPDILITDIEMPVMTGLELAAAIQEQKLACKVIMLTTFARTGYLRRALASAYAAICSKMHQQKPLRKRYVPCIQVAKRLHQNWQLKVGGDHKTH